MRAQIVQRFAAVRHAGHLILVPDQRHLQQLSHVPVDVDDKDAAAMRFDGRGRCAARAFS